MLTASIFAANKQGTGNPARPVFIGCGVRSGGKFSAAVLGPLPGWRASSTCDSWFSGAAGADRRHGCRSARMADFRRFGGAAGGQVAPGPSHRPSGMADFRRLCAYRRKIASFATVCASWAGSAPLASYQLAAAGAAARPAGRAGGGFPLSARAAPPYAGRPGQTSISGKLGANGALTSPAMTGRNQAPIRRAETSISRMGSGVWGHGPKAILARESAARSRQKRKDYSNFTELFGGHFSLDCDSGTKLLLGDC
jgi:hypothetical protein